uniref:THUMP domain-containing protein n=1 Tax=Globisporangium ultimum (strain ATCC 200006 / CBS 805.95 / DAOM BR144) TaxID=431595 RepID=K3X3L8_GLOUD
MAGEASGNKRKKQWKSDGQDANKRYKGALSSAASAKGSGGVLVTCDKTKERQSVRDALNILNEAADKFFPSTKQEADGGNDEDDEDDDNDASATATTVQQKLQDEINALKSDAKKRKTGRFTALDTGVKGVILIQILDKEISAIALITKIFEEVEATKEFASRFINRMIPLEKLGHAAKDDILELAKPMVEAHLKEFQEEQKKLHGDDAEIVPLEYAVEIKRRNCTHLNSMEVINGLAALVGPEQKVNLTAPKSIILVEVFRNYHIIVMQSTCGVSVVTKFHEYKKYNVRSILDPPVKGLVDQRLKFSKKKDEKEADKEQDGDAAKAAAKGDDNDAKKVKAE